MPNLTCSTGFSMERQDRQLLQKKKIASVESKLPSHETGSNSKLFEVQE